MPNTKAVWGLGFGVWARLGEAVLPALLDGLGYPFKLVREQIGLTLSLLCTLMMVSAMGGLQEELTVIMQNIAANPDTCGSPMT